jgi:hypothetical protein
MDSQFNTDLKELIELQNMVLLLLLYDQLPHFLFHLYIQEYSVVLLYLLLQLLFKMLKCCKECKIVGKKSLYNLSLKISSLIMHTLIT